MPPFTRLCVKTAFVFLLAGLGGQALLPLVPALYAWRLVFLHFLTVGWLTQMILGVAWWLFPLPDKPQGRAVPWALYGCLNGGLALRTLAEPVHHQAGLAGAAVLQGISGLLYLLVLWPRVRGKKKRA